jgi:SAM-dependent methyltransferase
MKEREWDKKLKIQTAGRDDSNADAYHHPYEPTPYGVLKRLADSGYISKENIVVDYGCGKGRVGFYLNYALNCGTVGLEYDETIYKQAVQNLESYVKKGQVSFFCQRAEEFEVKEADCFYFFNPFTVEILQAVMSRIMESYYERPRTMRLFFYYPDAEYISYLLAGGVSDEVSFVDEIDCSDLFEGEDSRERILIFELEGDFYEERN